MRRLASIFLLVLITLGIAQVASAIPITLTTYQLTNWPYGSSSVVTLKFFANQDFLTSDGQLIKAGNAAQGTGWFRSVTCTVVGTTITIPPITNFPTTTDSLTVPTATFTARFYTGATAREYFLVNFGLNHTYTATQSWDTVIIYNNPQGPPPDRTYPTFGQVGAMIDAAIGTIDNPINSVHCGGTDDTAALAAADATGPFIIDKNVTCATNTQSLSSDIMIHAGGFLKPLSGQTITISGSLFAPTSQVFLGPGKVRLNTTTNPTYKTAWWAEQTVTVPAPTAAPTLTDAGGVYGGTTFTNGVTYQVASANVAWNGKTGLSPVASFTAKNNQVIGVLPQATRATNSKFAVGAHIYISPDAGVTWHQAKGVFTAPALISFGDANITMDGTSLVTYDSSGAAPEIAGTTTTTKNGTVVPVPAAAPTIVNLGAIAAATYYGASSYLCVDGTESALSPISSGAVSAGGTYLKFQRNSEPPSGAVAVRVYLGTTASAGSLHLQKTIPLHHVRIDIHDYDSSGAAPSAGAAQSPISPLQQAYDSMMESGSAGTIRVTGGAFKCPIVLRLRNSSGSGVTGIEIVGNGGHGGVYNSDAAGRMFYAGSQTNSVVGVMYSTTNLKWDGLDVRDPNTRLSYGLGSCDFFGGGGFESQWIRSTFEGMKAGGIGYQIPNTSFNGAHTTSEQDFRNCAFNGDAWGMDVHGQQTANILFDNCEMYSGGNSNSANSGYARIATQGVRFIGWEGTGGPPQYVFFLTRDTGSSDNDYTRLDAENGFVDPNAYTSWIHVSAVGVNNSFVYLKDNRFQSSIECLAFYTGTSTSMDMVGQNGNAYGWVNWLSSVPDENNDRALIHQSGIGGFFGGLFGANPTLKITSAGTVSATNNADKVKVYSPTGILLSRTGTISTTPATLTGNVNNYNPGGLTYYQRWDSDASRNVSGLTHSGFQVQGDSHLIVNIGVNDIVLKHQSVSSDAANRFYCSTGADITLTAKKAVDIVYDQINQYWLVYPKN